MPVRPPASTAMLHRVMRSSIDNVAMVEPRYSMTCPTAPPAPIFAMRPRIRSFAVTPGDRRPLNVTDIRFGFSRSRHWLASTWPTSLVPIPNASAPKAPCVLVCESPQTMVRPGWVTPSSGPITWTIP